MLTDSLIGNEANQQVLQRLCGEDRLPHTIVIEGPRGSGRYLLARMISAMGVCRADPPGCGECVDCSLAMRGIHPDVELYAKSSPNGGYTREALRGLNGSAATPPGQGRRRVVILRDIQDAAVQSSLNILLKLLEEPPEYLMFLLTCDSRDNLLPTILSRSFLLRMELPSPEVCADEAVRLLEGAPSRDSALKYARLCKGNIGRTVTLLSDLPEAAAMKDAEQILSGCAQGQSGLYPVLRTFYHYERDRASSKELLRCLSELFGYLIEIKFRTPSGGADAFSELAQRFPSRKLLRNREAVEEAVREAASNPNLSLSLSRLSARLCLDPE